MKKGSLNLSINAIVIVVLAMTLLGLGLGFTRNMFKDLDDTTGKVTEQIQNQIMDDLRTGNKKLSFPSTEINIEKGNSEVLAFGVKNTDPQGEIKFVLIPTVLQAQKATAATGTPPVIGTITNPITDVEFFYDWTMKSLAITDADVFTVRMTADGDKGVYMTKLTVCKLGGTTITVPTTQLTECVSPNEIFAEKTFFVNVI